MRSRGALVWQLPEILLGSIVIILAVLINVQVFQRYVLNQSVGWSDELLRLLLVWITFLGGAVGVGRCRHLGMNFLGRWLPPEQLRGLNRLVWCLVLAFAAVVLWFGLDATRTAFGRIFTMTGIPVGWQYLAAPVAAALTMMYAARNLVAGREPIPTAFPSAEHAGEEA